MSQVSHWHIIFHRTAGVLSHAFLLRMPDEKLEHDDLVRSDLYAGGGPMHLSADAMADFDRLNATSQGRRESELLLLETERVMPLYTSSFGEVAAFPEEI